MNGTSIVATTVDDNSENGTKDRKKKKKIQIFFHIMQY